MIKKNFKWLFAGCIVLCLVLTGPVEALEQQCVEGDFTYTVSPSNTVTITGYTGSGGAVVIPTTIEGMPVVSIGTTAFYIQTSITSITIPNGVTSIGEGAFGGCSGLKSVTIPNSVVSIGLGAFNCCSGLKNINIPSSVTSMGMWAFYGCTSVTSVTIPRSITVIENGTFQYLPNLTNVSIPSSVTRIDAYAFFDNAKLRAAYFYGNAAPKMEFSVFYNCAENFTMFHTGCCTGFRNPMNGYPTAEFTVYGDSDGDGIPDAIDNCPYDCNALQLDANNNGIGDVCDEDPGCGGYSQPACEHPLADFDGDYIPDIYDNCPAVYNPQQLDANGNGIGDCCDPAPGCGGCGQVACDLNCISY